MPPLVSVIIPVYNREKLITRAIDSVLSQDYSNLEIIVVDDGSTDNTSKVLEKYSNQIIKVNNNYQSGPAGARNTGIEKAKGDYLAFLDSDDVFLKDKLSKQVKAMQSHEAHFSFTDNTYENYSKVISKDIPQLSNIFIPLLKQSLICTSTVVITKNVVKKIGLFDTSIFGTEDWDYWLRIAQQYPALYINEQLSLYSRNEDDISSLSGKRDGQVVNRFDDRIRIMQKLQRELNLSVAENIAIKERTAAMYFDRGYSENRITDYLKALRIQFKLKYFLALLKFPLKILIKS